MANCYANLITLKGNKKQIQKAYFMLGDTFDLSAYWDKYGILYDRNSVRLNDIGVLLHKNNNILKYYIWTKWESFSNQMVNVSGNIEKMVKHFQNGIEGLSEWLGIDDMEVLYYPAEYFEQGIFGFQSEALEKIPELYYGGWYYEDQEGWEIYWNPFSYNYIMELELKTHYLVKGSPVLTSKLEKNYNNPIREFLDRMGTDEEKRFSDFVVMSDFLTTNMYNLSKLVFDAKWRIKCPPRSVHSGSGTVETNEEIINFVRRYYYDYLSSSWRDMLMFNVFIIQGSRDNLEKMTGTLLQKYFEFTESLKEKKLLIDINCFLDKLLDLSFLYIDNDICGVNIVGLEPLGFLQSLESLYIVRTNSDLSPLTKLDKLKNLTLEFNTANLRPIAKIDSLQELTIIDDDDFKSDLRQLSKVKNISSLHLKGLYFKLDPLVKVKCLVELYLNWGISEKTELSPLAHMSNLLELNIQTTDIDVVDLSFLGQTEQPINITLNEMEIDPCKYRSDKDKTEFNMNDIPF